MAREPRNQPRVLMIGLDAGDPELIEQWINDGTLPHMGAIRSQGVMGRLSGPAKYLAGSPWPTMYTGRHVTSHGLYHDFQWRSQDMGFAAPTAEWLDLDPFWRNLEGDVDVVAYDIPFSPGCRPFRGIEMGCWASHDKLAAASSYPADLVDKARQEFGEWTVSYEGYGPGRIDELLALRQEMLDNTRRSAELAEWLLKNPWQLAIVCLSAPHRGGHRLWDRTSIKGPVTDVEGEQFDGALRDLYVACDEAIGKLVEAYTDATLVVFSTHGMTFNTSRVDFLDEMLARVLAGNEQGRRQVSLLRRFGEALPHELLRAITKNIPKPLRNRLVTLWSTGAIDWTKAKAFCCRADLQGYIRINQQAREPQGIVKPGQEFDDLCDEIAEGLGSFRDADTGEPFVEEVCRAQQIFPDGPRKELLPDMVVRWRQTPSYPHRAVHSPRYGTIQRTTIGYVPNGRSGNHREEGILLARGPGILQNQKVAGRPHILDLAPTVLERLRTACSVPLSGKPIPELVS